MIDHKLALVVDMRSRSFFSEIQAVLDELENQDDLDFKILFLDAADKELVARYKETRRSHPLAADGRILDGSSWNANSWRLWKIWVKTW